VSAKCIRTEKIFFKRTLFLKNKYYRARNSQSHRIDVNIDTMI